MSRNPSSGEASQASSQTTGVGAGGPGQQATALSRDLSEFLLELSIGVHRYAMYPPQHPSLVPAAENIIGRLGEIFQDRRTLSIGVARNQLVIEGVATDSKHPVLSDLARRLHGHQLGALTFRKGVKVNEVEGLLKALSQETERDGEPLGLRPRDEIPSWSHAQLFPLGYDRLGLKEDEEAGEMDTQRATQLWLGLARSAMTSEEPLEESEPPDPATVARSIRSHQREEAYDQVIVGYLLQLAEELKTGTTGEAESIRNRVSTLIRELDHDTLTRLVEMGGAGPQRREFLLDANQSLAVDSVVKILKAAAASSQQTISSSLTRLLGKLSAHAESGAERVRDQADTALRDNVEELIDEWELSDPNPEEYTLILDGMAKAAPLFAGGEEDEEEPLTGAHRLLQMAMEVGSWGPTVEKAVSDLMDEGEAPFIIDLLNSAPEGSRTGAALQAFLTSPGQLRRLLRGEDVDQPTLRVVVGRMGPSAIPVLLDGLTESEFRSVRRKVFDVLAEMGEDVAEGAMARLDEPRWYVVRNMLALIQRLPETPEGFSAADFMEHEDPRVRREAFPLALRVGKLRKRALATALADSDERLVRKALVELQEEIPETLVPVVVSRVIRSSHASDLRVLGVRALGGSKSALGLEALMEVASSGKTLLGRRRLASHSPEMVAAIQVLRESWSHDPRAREILDAARKSKEVEVQRAAGVPGGGT